MMDRGTVVLGINRVPSNTNLFLQVGNKGPAGGVSGNSIDAVSEQVMLPNQ